MRLLTYILVILLFLPVKARGEAIDTPVEPLLLYKAKQDVRCQQWVDSIMNKLTLIRLLRWIPSATRYC